DNVLVLNRDHGHIEANHLTGFPGKIASSRDDMFSPDITFVRLHEPAAIRLLLDGGNSRVAMDGGAEVTRSLGERLREIGRLNITVVRMLDSAQQPVGFAQRPDLL